MVARSIDAPPTWRCGVQNHDQGTCGLNADAVLAALLATALGAALGFVARRTQLCTLGAIADAALCGDDRRARALVLAMAVAVLGTQGLAAFGLIELERSIYLAGDFGWLGAALGGGAFGFGMALVGTCGFGVLVRLGSGDLKALIAFMTLGIVAYATISGPLAYLREMVIEAADLSLPTAPGLVEVTAGWLRTDAAALRLLLAVAVAGPMLVYALAPTAAPARRGDRLAGVVVGLVIVLGWVVTGMVAQDAFEPKPLLSFSFVRPLGDTILYAMLASAVPLGFGTASVVGVVVGAALAGSTRRLRREAFDGVRELRRHLVGAALMGFGGVVALGCTIGQGISGMSTLALSAPLALGGIIAGAVIGLRYLETGSLLGAARAIVGRE
jgi:hypothetical protein